MSNHLFIEASRNGRGVWQLAIVTEHVDGSASGYRLAGPKFDGSGGVVFRHPISERDRAELTAWLAEDSP